VLLLPGPSTFVACELRDEKNKDNLAIVNKTK